MRVLWVVNSVLPEVLSSLTGQESRVSGSGGWLQASAQVLSSSVDLCVAAVSDRVTGLYRFDGEKIRYYLLPCGKGNIRVNREYVPFWQRIYDEFKPDLVHLHGTELPHGLSLMEALPGAVTVISIQGLMSRIWPHFNDGISRRELLGSITLRDLALDLLKPEKMCGTLCSREKNFRLRGRTEPLIFQKAKAVMGRTSWDRKEVLSMNPELKYFTCNETLRPQFYEGRWSYGKCTPHTIFLSQAMYPFKGLHMVLKALPDVLAVYPGTRVVVAGDNILRGDSLSDRLGIDGYALYIKRLMKRLCLTGKQIFFTGPLDAEGMKEQYLGCNVFINPSAIENSPNSLCEAQMLGVPCISTDAGGSKDMIPDEKCGKLYSFDDTKRLSSLIIDVFASSSSFDGSHEQAVAAARHDPFRNQERLMEIYRELTA